MDDHDDLDVDFDFKSMLSHIDDAFEAELLSPPPPVAAGRNAPPLHPRQHQALSIGEMLDSRLFKPDAPWSIGGSRSGIAAAPPPPATFNGAIRNSRSNSGVIISSRLRAASDMHQQGYLTVEEKSLMKDLILSRNPQFKEEFNNAERTNNWYNLQQFIRTYHLRRTSPANSFTIAMDDLTQEFGALNTPPPPGYSMVSEATQSKSARKRMASQSTPVARPRKTTTSAKKLDPTSYVAAKSRSLTSDEPLNAEPSLEVQSNTSTGENGVIDMAIPAEPQRRESPPAATAATSASTTSNTSSSTFVSKLPTKPIAQMDDKELEIEAAIAAAEGDAEAVAKIRKNERERRRRLAVSNGFDELFELLKLPQAAQIDKVSILRKAIDRIRELEAKVTDLEAELSNSQSKKEEGA